MDKDTIRTFVLPLAVIVLLGAILRLVGVAQQPALSDEVSVALSAVHYSEDGQFGPTMWYHPNLRNVALYTIGTLFGYGPYALRGMSLFTGILSVFLLGVLVYVLTKDRIAALVAAFLLSIEQVHITFSRQAIQETWTTFFFLAGVVLAYAYHKRDRAFLLVLSGVAFGLGMASKFHAFFPLLVSLAALVYLAWKDRSGARAVFAISCLVVTPMIIYLLTYVPWFGRGYDLFDWVRMQHVISVTMTTHPGNPMDQLIDTKAWQWFLRPMGYANFVISGGRPFLTVAYSNPLVWLLILPSAAYLAWRSLRKDSRPEEGTLLLLALFIVSYVPLACSPRPIWILSSLAVIPFGFAMIAIVASRAAKSVPWGKSALVLYLAGVLVSSLALYPMAVGKGKSYAYLDTIAERFRPEFERR